MATNPDDYPARLAIDYPPQLDRFSTFFRAIFAIPILVLFSILTASSSTETLTSTGEKVSTSGMTVIGGLALATALMIAIRGHYPRWWFDFAYGLTRFGARICAYLALLTDRYPSTVDEQSVHLEVDYPDVGRDLNRFLPLIKWILVLPHLIILALLLVLAVLAVIGAWFAILFTGQYPRGLFDFVTGVGRWSLRVQAYALLLVTDRYPPFSLT
ncbi:MAG: DUF4389 domain-containing protein [Vicinamibacterales bacterium]